MEKSHTYTPLLAANLTMAVTFGVHLFIDGPELHAPLCESSLSHIEQATFSVIWHVSSTQLFLHSAALFYLARHWKEAVFAYAFAPMAGFALFFIGYEIVDLIDVLAMPLWIAFLLALVYLLWGLRRS